MKKITVYDGIDGRDYTVEKILDRFNFQGNPNFSNITEIRVHPDNTMEMVKYLGGSKWYENVHGTWVWSY